jgi:hypothetical protein
MQHLLIKDALGATQIIRPHYKALGLQKKLQKWNLYNYFRVKAESARSLHYGKSEIEKSRGIT